MAGDGFNQSGLGRELGSEDVEAFREIEHVHIGLKDWWYAYGPGQPDTRPTAPDQRHTV